MSKLGGAGQESESEKRTIIFGILAVVILVVLFYTIDKLVPSYEIGPSVSTSTIPTTIPTTLSTSSTTTTLKIETTSTTTSTIPNVKEERAPNFVVIKRLNTSKYYPVYLDTKAIAVYIKNVGDLEGTIALSAHLPDGSGLRITPDETTIGVNETKRFQIRIQDWQVDDTANVIIDIDYGSNTIVKTIAVKKFDEKAIIITRITV